MVRKLFTLIYLILFISISGINSIALDLKRQNVGEDIEYIPVNPHTYILVSYANLPGYGRLGTNHLLYIKNNRAFLFDSPYDDALAEKLYQWVKKNLNSEITAVSISHWHQDHSGGLKAFHRNGIETYSSLKTKEMMETAGLESPRKTFSGSLKVNFEGTEILLAFCGEGHTSDNTVGWIESEKILFSGSVIRAASDKNLGYMKDANVKAWPRTVRNIQKKFGRAALIIPGHGDAGGPGLIKHTASLAQKNTLQ